MNSTDSDYRERLLKSLRERLLKSLEDYYRDTYPAIMRKKVLEILPRRADKLKALQEILIRDPDAWKRSVKVPDVAAVEKALQEMAESHPEFSARSLPESEYLQIEEDIGFDPKPLFDKLREAMQRRKERIS